MTTETNQLITVRNFQQKIGDVLAVEGISVENFNELNGIVLQETDSKMFIEVISFEPDHYNKSGNMGFMLSGISFGCWLKTYFKDGSNIKSNAYGRGYAYLSASIDEEKHHTRYNVILDEIEIKSHVNDHRQKNLEAHYGLVEWRFKEMYRRAYPSIDIEKKDDWLFKTEEGEEYLEPTHFWLKNEDQEELFKCDGDLGLGFMLVFSSPSRFESTYPEWVAMKVIEIFRRFNYTDEQRKAFVTAWYNLASEYEDFDWVRHFLKLEELTKEHNLELPRYVYMAEA